jgi:hypothetical protein
LTQLERDETMLGMRSAWALVVAAAAATASCQLAYGLDDYHAEEATSGGAGGGATTSTGARATTSSTATGSAGGHPASSSATTSSGAGAGCATTCVPLRVEGWNGPFTVASQAASLPPSTCATGATRTWFDDAPTTDARCDSCTCGACHATCTPPTIIEYGASLNCTGSGSSSQGASCDYTGSAEVQGAATPHGPCDASGGAATLDTYGTAVTACDAATTDGCGAGSACAPAGRTCVEQIGNVVGCPAPYTDRELVFEDADDQRGCTACDCEAPVTCTGQYVYWSGLTTCGVNGTPATTGVCITPNNAFNVVVDYAGAGATQAGACAPSGGAPTGMFEPTHPHTLCCLP